MSIDELDDFCMDLDLFKQKVEELIKKYGPKAQIYVSAGYNNVGVYVRPE